MKNVKYTRTHICLTLCALLLLALSACTGPTTQPDGTASTPANTAQSALSPPVKAVKPLPLAEAQPPVELSIVAIDLTVPVVEMGWHVVQQNDERTTEWEVPYAEAGWHVNSAGAGAAGNTVISGHQVSGEAVFAPIALGDVEVGQEILLIDGEGNIFAYRVSEVTEPIPATGATEEEQALAASYAAPTEEAQLTLITGWPDFTTTHYLFVIAEFEGQAQ